MLGGREDRGWAVEPYSQHGMLAQPGVPSLLPEQPQSLCSGGQQDPESLQPQPGSTGEKSQPRRLCPSSPTSQEKHSPSHAEAMEAKSILAGRGRHRKRSDA